LQEVKGFNLFSTGFCYEVRKFHFRVGCGNKQVIAVGAQFEFGIAVCGGGDRRFRGDALNWNDGDRVTVGEALGF
jgi:hypothetical protein